MQWIEGLGAVAGRYGGLIVDLWGVMHDGVAAYPAAVDALRRYRADGGRVVLLSNAPRPSAVVARHMARIGVAPDCHDHLITSGDATRAALASGDLPGTHLFHLGPARDRATFEGLAWRETDDLAIADVVLATGMFDDAETAEDYRAMLERARDRDLPLLCANPDRVVMRGEERLVCPGALADLYDAIGGRSLRWGKPYPGVYAMALAALDLPVDQVLAIGDSIETDIAGAAGAGIHALIVATGIHAAGWTGADGAPDPARIAADCAAAGHGPQFATAALVW